jgi:hypothetical protein
VTQYEYVVQALHAGHVVIPRQTFTYFDPAKRACYTLYAPEQLLTVQPRAVNGIVSNQNKSVQQGVEKKNTDSATLIDELYAMSIWDWLERLSLPWWLFVLLLVAPWSVELYRATSTRLLHTRRALPSRRALFKQTRKACQAALDHKEYKKLHALFTQFCITIFKTHDQEAWVDILARHGCSSEEVVQWRQLWVNLAAAAFGGQGADNTMHAHNARYVMQWLDRLERVI